MAYPSVRGRALGYDFRGYEFYASIQSASDKAPCHGTHYKRTIYLISIGLSLENQIGQGHFKLRLCMLFLPPQYPSHLLHILQLSKSPGWNMRGFCNSVFPFVCSILLFMLLLHARVHIIVSPEKSWVLNFGAFSYMTRMKTKFHSLT